VVVLGGNCPGVPVIRKKGVPLRPYERFFSPVVELERKFWASFQMQCNGRAGFR